MFSARDLDIVLYIAEKGRANLKELVDHFSREWSVSRQAVYSRIERLIKNDVLAKKRIGRNIIMIEFSTKFLIFMEKIVEKMYSSKSIYYDRLRKAKKEKRVNKGYHAA